MATGATSIYDLPFPTSTDPVNVHGDIQSLAEQIENVLSNIGTPFISQEVHNSSGSTISKGDPVYITGNNAGKPTIEKSTSDILSTFPVAGIATTNIADGSDGVIIISGIFAGLDTSSYDAGDILYTASSGGLTTSGSGAIAIVVYSNASNGIILIGQPKGNGTWGSLKAGLS